MALANTKRQIRNFKTRLTNINTELAGNAYALPDPQTPLTLRAQLTTVKADGAKLQKAIDNLETWRQNYVNNVENVEDGEYDAAVQELENFLDAENIDQIQNQARDRVDFIVGKRLELENLLAVHEPVANVAPAARALEDDGLQHAKWHMPEIDLEIFHGQYHRWLEWWQSFESLVHNKNLDRNLKYRYLLKYTKGKARRAISGMAVTNENYNEAIRILRERFGDERLVVDALNTRLQQIPKAGEATQDVRHMIDSVQYILGQLKQLHENTNSRHTELIIGQRLPEWALLKILETERDYKIANQGNAAAHGMST